MHRKSIKLSRLQFPYQSMLKCFPWAVAIIAARETSETLKQTIWAAERACAGRDAVIDVLVNGNPELAHDVASWATAASMDVATVKVWAIPKGDKAHAWNEYVHRIWPAGRAAFFLDGYAQPKANSFSYLAASLAQGGDVLGATGVPSVGRSAQGSRARMIQGGRGFQGNMHVIAAPAMLKLREVGFRLPLGLYRTDSLIGALLLFGLDPAVNKWETRRIVVSPDATWDIPDKTTLTVKNLIGQFKRRLRQAQGDLENRAVRNHLAERRAPIQQMPRTARELVLSWIDANPGQARSLFIKSPLRLYAASKLRTPQDWTAADIPPSLLCNIEGGLARIADVPG